MPDVFYGPAVYNVTMTQGDTFREVLTLRDGNGVLLDLDGFTVSSQVRRTAAGTVVAQMDIAVGTGTITRSIGTATTATMDGEFVHDLDYTSAEGVRRTLLAGSFRVVSEVTR
jgi:hypothetical protein